MARKAAAAVKLLSGQRQKGESNAAVIACNDYLRLGIGRTLPKLLSRYTESNQLKPPTTSLQTLKDWSMKYGWQERADEYDAAWEAQKNAERRAVMAEGLALDYERTRKLFRLAEFLEEQLYEQSEGGVYHNVWLPDVKQIGSGDNAERVDIERFNAALIEQFRGVLDDIAKEVGGRIRKQEVTGADGKPIPIIITKMNLDDI